MKIKQFSGNWVQSEDRILLRFITSDSKVYSFWLTRHIACKLIHNFKTLSSLIAQKKSDAKKASLIHSFKEDIIRENIKNGENFNQEVAFPLGKSPVLVVDLNIENRGGEIVALNLKLIGKKILHVDWNFSYLQAFVVLVTQIQCKSMWNLDVQFSDADKSDNLSNLRIPKKNTFH